MRLPESQENHKRNKQQRKMNVSIQRDNSKQP